MGFFFVLRKIIDITISHLENFELKKCKNQHKSTVFELRIRMEETEKY